VGYEQLMDSLNRRRRRKQHSLPKPASPQNLLYGRHIESELGIDVMTILECVWGKRDRCNLWITDFKSVCFSKSLVSRLQEEVLTGLDKVCKVKS